MNNTNTGGAAYPRPFSENPARDEMHPAQTGKTLLDDFAGKAMQGMIAAGDFNFDRPDEDSALCYRVGKAMIEARKAATQTTKGN